MGEIGKGDIYGNDIGVQNQLVRLPKSFLLVKVHNCCKGTLNTRNMEIQYIVMSKIVSIQLPKKGL